MYIFKTYFISRMMEHGLIFHGVLNMNQVRTNKYLDYALELEATALMDFYTSGVISAVIQEN